MSNMYIVEFSFSTLSLKLGNFCRFVDEVLSKVLMLEKCRILTTMDVMKLRLYLNALDNSKHM